MPEQRGTDQRQNERTDVTSAFVCTQRSVGFLWFQRLSLKLMSGSVLHAYALPRRQSAFTIGLCQFSLLYTAVSVVAWTQVHAPRILSLIEIHVIPQVNDIEVIPTRTLQVCQRQTQPGSNAVPATSTGTAFAVGKLCV